jgi:hypothetical protein
MLTSLTERRRQGRHCITFLRNVPQFPKKVIQWRPNGDWKKWEGVPGYVARVEKHEMSLS